MSRASAVLGAFVALVVAAPAAASGALAPTADRSFAARLVIPTSVHRAADAASPVVRRLGTLTHWAHGPMQLLVLDDRTDASGRRWLRVRLAERPNDGAGWIDAEVVRLTRNPWRIDVSTAARTVRVYRAGRLMRRFRAVVGTAGTPTPHGLFAVYEHARQPDPRGFLGPWALHLTAHSEVLKNFGGGAGRVAIHGRSGASLADPLGTARSHGCVRVPNGDVSWLAKLAVPGTPVRVS